jgi:flagellar biosynthetic protein FliP
MTLGPLFGVAAALGVVLALLGLAMRALNRFARVGSRGAGSLPMEVVARLGLAPRQGLAVVRVGERAVVVSVGDGGVRPVLELTAEELAALDAGPSRATRGAPELAALSGRLRGVLRGIAGVAAIVAAVAAVPSSAVARSAEPAEAPAVAPAQLPASTPGAAAGTATVDSIAGALLPRLDLRIGDGDESGLRLRGTVGTVVVLGLLALLPTLILLMTSFTRILVVLHFLRQALGTQSTPPGHLLAALALLLTGFVMAPTLAEMNEVALRPWVEGRMEEGEMLRAAVVPLREFMLRQTSQQELATFLDMSESVAPETPDDVPLVVLVSAFAIHELKTAFQIGFAIFLPFIVIDLVVAAVLTSMGMFMLPPAMIALPCKLMLFVLVDGWSLVVQSLVASFR